MKKYDYLIVGAGLYGAAFARIASDHGKRCLVVEKRGHIGGNCYTENDGGITVHRYGAHIFHTSDREVWEFVNRYAFFRPYINSPVAKFGDKIYNLPFNMNTFYALWGVVTPDEARAKIREQIPVDLGEPRNLEEQALKLVGRDIYRVLIEGYTQKQWGRPCSELPAFIIRRLPLRFTFDNNYFNDTYQGIPAEGYTAWIEKMLDGIEVVTGVDFLSDRAALSGLAERTVYTGRLDEYYDFRYGELEYRSLRFETVRLETDNFQGCAVVNYTAKEIPYTRIVEHKHFAPGADGVCGTVLTYEYPEVWGKGKEAFYPVNNEKNDAIAERYRSAARDEGLLFGGRLADYRYYDMDKILRRALDDTGNLF